VRAILRSEEPQVKVPLAKMQNSEKFPFGRRTSIRPLWTDDGESGSWGVHLSEDKSRLTAKRLPIVKHGFYPGNTSFCVWCAARPAADRSVGYTKLVLCAMGYREPYVVPENV
jgi:hypothetical protein